ncbi:MAG TPA: SAM-dependent methyltransferase [Streptosporangiaceae bacterium]
MPPGSYLVLSHGTYDFVPPETAAKLIEVASPTGRAEFHPRTKAEFARFFAGLDLIPPGITPLAEWRAETEPQPRPSAADIAGYAAVARIG